MFIIRLHGGYAIAIVNHCGTLIKAHRVCMSLVFSSVRRRSKRGPKCLNQRVPYELNLKSKSSI